MGGTHEPGLDIAAAGNWRLVKSLIWRFGYVTHLEGCRMQGYEFEIDEELV